MDTHILKSWQGNMAGIKHKTCLRQYLHCGPSVEKKIEMGKEDWAKDCKKIKVYKMKNIFLKNEK